MFFKFLQVNKSLLLYLSLWFVFSGCTLFLNKYIVAYQEGDALFLSVVQLFCCSLSSYLYLSYWRFNKSKPEKTKSQFAFQLLFVNFFRLSVIGALRFSTVALGLIALWYIPVSFAEIIKSSAPIFTVLISILVLNEKCSLLLFISLFPIMLGLSLCSAFELHFNLTGFLLALLGNLSECFQNVLSKRVLTVEKYEPNQIQLFTSVYSCLFQIPYLYYFIYTRFTSITVMLENHWLIINCLLSGLSFHFQTLTEYALLNIISPVSHSVANTVKRATLIWLSVIVFGNPVTFQSWIGTILVIAGVLLYNKAKELLNFDQLAHSKSIDSV